MVATHRGLDPSDCVFVFIFDEITNLGDALLLEQERLDQQQVRHNRISTETSSSLSAHFYSSINSIIMRNCIVLLSGFSEPRVSLGGSGRSIKAVVLKPISSVIFRRELHVMKTDYFNSVAHFGKNVMKDAILYYELVKSNPGLIGTFLEKFLEIVVAGNFLQDSTFSDLVELSKIPIIRDIENSPQMRSSILEVLKLKSIYFENLVSNSSISVEFIRNECRQFIVRSVERAVKNKVVDASLSGNYLNYLTSARLEPLFVYSFSGDKSEQPPALVEYWNILQRFSSGDLDSIQNRFGLVRKELVRKSAKRTKSAKSSSRRGSDDSLTGAFFEDAVAVGLLAQRQLRRMLMKTEARVQEGSSAPFHEIQLAAVSTLAEYLSGSRVVFSRRRKSKRDNSSGEY